VVGVAAVFVAAGALVGVKLFSLRGSGDVLTKMAPADADAYVTVYLDPSLGQKVALRDLVNQFPAADGVSGLQERIDQSLDHALAPTGVRYTTDVKPWVGSQISLVVRFTGQTPHLAVLIASKDDGAATDALAKIEAKDRTRGPTRVEHHAGLRIVVCTCPDSTDVFGYTDHTAILGDDLALVEDVIDTGLGGQSLSSSASYQQAVAELPADRLVLGYANVGGLIRRFGSTLGAGAGLEGGGLFTGSAAGLGAYQGVGMALFAQPDGVGLDVNVAVDPTKLTADQRAAMEADDHLNTTLAWTPEQAYAVFAMGNVNTSSASYVDQVSKAEPEAAAMLRRAGVIGPDGLLSHLTGDLGVEASPGLGPIPDVAVLAATDDEAAARRSLDALARTATKGLASTFGSAGADIPPPTWHTFDDTVPGGTLSISWLSAPQLAAMGIEPAYATLDGMIIVGSSRHAIEAAVDAHGGKGDVTSSPDFRAALAHGNVNSPNLEYVDIGAVVEAIRNALPPEIRQGFEVDTEPNLQPLRTFIATSESVSDRTTVKLFLTIR
jgi:hypothetical protein